MSGLLDGHEVQIRQGLNTLARGELKKIEDGIAYLSTYKELAGFRLGGETHIWHSQTHCPACERIYKPSI